MGNILGETESDLLQTDALMQGLDKLNQEVDEALSVDNFNWDRAKQKMQDLFALWSQLTELIDAESNKNLDELKLLLVAAEKA